MKCLLLFFLILVLRTTLCNAQCFIKPSSNKGCSRLGKVHQVHTVWKTRDCFRCECKPGEMICCNLVFRPINYDKKNCVAMFHKPTCSIRVVKKTNPTEACKVFAGVELPCPYQLLATISIVRENDSSQEPTTAIAK